MSDLAYITTHVADAQARLLSQYKRPNLLALIGVLAGRMQGLEDALWAQSPLTYLQNAAGQQLDNIAAFVGVDRNGLTDGQLRALIRARIAQQTGRATLPAIVDVVKGLFQTPDAHVISPDSFQFVPQRAGATVRIGIGTTQLSADEIQVCAQYLSEALAAGVSLVQVTNFVSGNSFAFAGPRPWVQGFGVGVFANSIFANKAA